MTKKNDDKITAAGAVELEENELDQVTGGYTENDSKGKRITGISGVNDPIVTGPIAKGPAGYIDKTGK